MKNQYEELLSRILDTSSPDPTVELFSSDQLNQIRAGLSRAKQTLETMSDVLGTTSPLASMQFKYTPDPTNENHITISLVPRNRGFTIKYVEPTDGKETPEVPSPVDDT